MKRIKLLIADDHTIVRNGLNSIFECEEGFEIIGEAVNGKELVDKALTLKPHVVISDLKMPFMSGIEAAEKIKSVDSSIKVIILTAYDEVDDVQKAINVGVDGYMLKDTFPDELVNAVDLVYKGYSCIYLLSIREMIIGGRKHIYGRIEFDGLTEREMEVYELIAQNYSNMEIARKLFISEATVKSHVSKILRKTGQPNRAQAVLYGLSKGLFNTDSFMREKSV